MADKQDRYDLEDMMDRLKSRSKDETKDEGEVVTREDGSKAIRVRRRKRRSRQPHKERQKFLRKLQVSTGLIVILLIVLGIGFVTVYVNTAPFRKQVAHKLGVTSGAEVQLKQFRMNPIGANVGGIELEWPSGNVLQSLSLRTIQADISPFGSIAGRLSGKELNVSSGELLMHIPESGKPKRATQETSGRAPVRFGQSAVQSLSVFFEGVNSPVFQLKSAEATLTPAEEERGTILRMVRGRLQIHQWPLLRLDRAYLEFEDDQTHVIGMSLKHGQEDHGKIELEGTIRPYGTDPQTTLSVSANAFLLSGLIGDSMASLMEGRIESATEHGLCEMVLGMSPDAETGLTMAFKGDASDSMQVGNLPCLYGISQILGDDWFVRPVFRDRVRGQVIRQGSRVELRDLDLHSNSRIAIRGHLTDETGRLSGELEIGMPIGLIQAPENRAFDAMFGEPRDGLRWLKIEVSGSSAAPKDNFSQLYKQALAGLGDLVPSSEGAQAKPFEGTEFEALTQPR